jgi:two-component system, OmpR family, response regulator ChvI
MQKISVIHGDAEFLEGCRDAFECAGFAVETHRTGQSALRTLERRMPDVVVLSMSDESLEAMRILQMIRNRSTIPVILMTENAEEIDEVMGLRLGADAILRMPVAKRVIIEWIRSLLKRHEALRASVDPSRQALDAVTVGHLRMDPALHLATWRGQDLSLTATEFKILAALTARPGLVKSRAALIDMVHSNSVYVDERTIDSHVKRIRLKIRAIDPAFDAITTLYGVGYRFSPPETPKQLRQEPDHRPYAVVASR